MASLHLAVSRSAYLPFARCSRHRVRRLGNRRHGRLARRRPCHRDGRPNKRHIGCCAGSEGAGCCRHARQHVCNDRFGPARRPGASGAELRVGAWGRHGVVRGGWRRRRCAPRAGRIAARAGIIADRRERSVTQGSRPAPKADLTRRPNQHAVQALGYRTGRWPRCSDGHRNG